MMQTFLDKTGRSWNLSITIDSIKRVRAISGHDLLACFSGGLLKAIYSDLVVLGDILWGLCEPQARGQNITGEQFGDSLAGPCLLDARLKLLEELADFSPSPREATILRETVAKTEKLADLLTDQELDRIKAMEPEALIKKIRDELKTPSTTPPESVA